MTQLTRRGLTGRLFNDHPHSLGMSWLEHGLGAMRIAGTMIAAGLACAVHAIFPGLFTETAGRTVISLHDLKVNKRASGRHKDLNDLEHLP